MAWKPPGGAHGHSRSEVGKKSPRGGKQLYMQQCWQELGRSLRGVRGTRGHGDPATRKGWLPVKCRHAGQVSQLSDHMHSFPQGSQPLDSIPPWRKNPLSLSGPAPLSLLTLSIHQDYSLCPSFAPRLPSTASTGSQPPAVWQLVAGLQVSS